MRADGTPLKGLSPYAYFFPKLMVTRTDSQNSVVQYVDMEPLRKYSSSREQGRVRYMSFIICAYLKTLAKYPELNRFIAGRKIYQRNDVSVSFVMMKDAGGDARGMDQTVVKVHFDLTEDLGQVEAKISEAIRREREEANGVDGLLNVFVKFPFLLGPFAALARFLERRGWLPASIIEVSPFHTSLFFSNLTSIGVEHIFHHLYEFGTTSVFIAMGRPVRWHPLKGEGRYLPLGIVMDERICTGYEYGRFYRHMEKYLSHPETMEGTAGPEEPEEPIAVLTAPAE